MASKLTLENVFRIISAAEKIAGSPLFGKLKGLLPEVVPLTDAELASLDENYEKYLKAIAESRTSEVTGRAPVEGDTD